VGGSYGDMAVAKPKVFTALFVEVNKKTKEKNVHCFVSQKANSKNGQWQKVVTSLNKCQDCVMHTSWKRISSKES
jgi:hypothetical protein